MLLETAKGTVIIMNNLLINYFLTVAENKSFSIAAKKLYVSQPTISRQISFLEDELGFALFNRSIKPIELTEAGELFYDYFQNCKRGLDETIIKASLLEKERTTTITLGCPEGWSLSHILPKLVCKFENLYPNVNISLDNRTFKNIISGLENRELDLILTIGFTLPDKKLKVRTISYSSRVIIYSDKHPLFNKKDITPYDFRNYTFFAINDYGVFSTEERITKWCEPYGFIPKIKLVRSHDAMISNIQCGLGVGITDMWSWVLKMEYFRYIILNSQHDISLAWLPDNKNPFVNIVIKELEHLINSDG